jgi:hypothetical protein
MMKDNFLSKVILFFAVVLVTIYGCNSNKSKQQEIVGEWKASWKTAPDDQLSEINEENLKMNGPACL